MDDAGVLDIATVAAAARSAGSSEQVVVYVRTVDDLAGASIDSWFDGVLARCENWREARNDDNADKRLLVIAVAPNDRQTGIYYANRLRPVLDSRFENIMADDMNPQFRNGDFTAGVLAGLDELVSAVDGNAAPPAAPIRQTPPSSPTQSDDGGGMGRSILLVLGAVALLGGIGAAGVWIVRLRSREAAERLAFEETMAEVVTARNRVAHLIARRDADISELKASVAEAAAVNAGDGAVLVERGSEWSAEYLAATQAAGDVYAVNPSLVEPDVLADHLDALNEAVTQLDALVQVAAKLTTMAEACKVAAVELEQTAAAAAAAAARALAAIDVARSDGWVVDSFDATLTKIEGDFEAAEKAAAERKVGAASAAFVSVTAAADVLAADCAALPADAALCAARVGNAQALIDEAVRSIAEGRSAISELTSTRTSDVWETHAGGGAEVWQSELDAGIAALAGARERLADRDPAAAEVLLDEFDAHAGAADLAADMIVERRDALVDSSAKLAESLDDADDHIDDAGAFVDEWSADLDSTHAANIAAARAAYQQAVSVDTDGDSVAAYMAARKAAEMAQRTLREARDDIATLERQVARQRDEARNAVSSAERDAREARGGSWSGELASLSASIAAVATVGSLKKQLAASAAVERQASELASAARAETERRRRREQQEREDRERRERDARNALSASSFSSSGGFGGGGGGGSSTHGGGSSSW